MEAKGIERKQRYVCEAGTREDTATAPRGKRDQAVNREEKQAPLSSFYPLPLLSLSLSLPLSLLSQPRSFSFRRPVSNQKTGRRQARRRGRGQGQGQSHRSVDGVESLAFFFVFVVVFFFNCRPRRRPAGALGPRRPARRPEAALHRPQAARRAPPGLAGRHRVPQVGRLALVARGPLQVPLERVQGDPRGDRRQRGRARRLFEGVRAVRVQPRRRRGGREAAGDLVPRVGARRARGRARRRVQRLGAQARALGEQGRLWRLEPVPARRRGRDLGDPAPHQGQGEGRDGVRGVGRAHPGVDQVGE